MNAKIIFVSNLPHDLSILKGVFKEGCCHGRFNDADSLFEEVFGTVFSSRNMLSLIEFAESPLRVAEPSAGIVGFSSRLLSSVAV